MSEKISETQSDAAPSEDRRNFLKTATLIGAAGAVAGTMHGKFGLAPVVTQAQAQTAPQRRNGGPRNGAPPTRPAPRTTSRPPRCSMRSNGSATARSTRSAAPTSRACRCSARAPSRYAFRAARPEARSARTSSSITTNISRPDRPGRHPVRRPRPHRPSVCGHSTASGLPGWTPSQPRAGGVAPGCARGPVAAGRLTVVEVSATVTRSTRCAAGGRGRVDPRTCAPPVPSRCASRQQAPVTQHALGQLGRRRHVVALAGLGR